MSAGMSTAGLRLEQAPPLGIPLGFFLTAPFGLVVAGGLLAARGGSLLVTRFGGTTAALAHLGTLGFLAAVMLGALYQMIPVVAGAPVPMVRSAHVTHAALFSGLVALAIGLSRSSRATMILAAALLALALLAFLGPVSVALARAPARGPTVNGMRVSVAGLATLASLGVLMSLTRGSSSPAPAYPSWMAAHIAVGCLVWIGGLVTAVSFQVVPMFYLAKAPNGTLQRVLVALVALALVTILTALALGWDTPRIALAASPAALAVWFLHPVLTLRAIFERRRKRTDPSLLFWRAGLGAGLLSLPVSVAAVLADDFRWPVLLGWLALFGWAGLVVHGMLTRIVPFLVWFHRYSPLVGKQPVPSMRELLPDRYSRSGFVLHLSTAVAGVGAIVTGADALARLTGAGLMLTGGALFASLVRVAGSGPSVDGAPGTPGA